MEANLIRLARKLQSRKVLPRGSFSHSFREEQASYICYLSLAGGYYIKKLKSRIGKGLDQDCASRIARETANLKKYYPVFVGDRRFEIPELVYSSQQDCVIVTKAINGKGLDKKLKEFCSRLGPKSNESVKWCENLGSFLSILHRSEQAPFSESDLESLLKFTRSQLGFISFSAQESADLLEYMQSLHDLAATRIDEFVSCPVHHDLSPSNILVDNGSIGILDFADAQMAPPYQDLSYFKLMIERQLGNSVRYRSASVRELLAAFYEGYGCNPEALRENPLYRLCELKNLLIFVKTFVLTSESIRLPGPSPRGLKSYLQNYFDMVSTKKSLLKLVRTGSH